MKPKRDECSSLAAHLSDVAESWVLIPSPCKYRKAASAALASAAVAAAAAAAAASTAAEAAKKIKRPNSARKCITTNNKF